MKFTILSHAGLAVETRDCSLVMDPWLVGSCYWRSWWNYPPPPRAVINGLSPDFIYITHLHWDHFHGPSLKRFDRDTPVLIPQATFGRMVEDLEDIGFTDVRELVHGKSYPLKGGTVVTSYQFGMALDSALLIDTGEGVLFNANDCKLMGWPLKQIVRRHPRIDFVFKSHSSASCYPFCVSSEFPEHLTYRSNEDRLEEFLAFAEYVGARYAVPFASNHCHLHRDTRQFNSVVVSPADVKSYFDAHRQGPGECVVMLPGDSFSNVEGFRIANSDYLSNRSKHIEELEERYRAKLESTYQRESKVMPDWNAFNRYFSAMLSALPPGFGRIMPARVLYHVVGRESAWWLVDFGKRTIEREANRSMPHDLMLEVSAGVLRDCCQKRMFSVFTASKRLHIHLVTKAAYRHMRVLNTVMDLYESEYFPVSKMLRRRFVLNWLRRWREMAFYALAGSSLALGRRFRPSNFLKRPRRLAPGV
jgi:UDP-MurNAc hydroxylase